MEGPCHESSSGCTPPATAPTADSSIVMPFPDSFATARLRAERLTPEHFAELRRMDRDPEFMAMLGGPRDDAQTAAYLARNLQHWTDYRSEEHTSELQSRSDLVCRLLLEKKKKNDISTRVYAIASS